MSDPTFDFEQMVCFALYSSSNAMVRHYAKPLAHLGVTYPQLLVLAALWEQDDVSASTLSEKTLYDLGALTPIVKRLEAAGLVKVYLDPSDRRRRNVQLTAQGRKLKPAAAEVFNNTSCQIDLSPQEIAQVLSICRKVKRQLGA